MEKAPRSVRGVAALVAAMVVGLILSAGAQAAPGDLDLTFSGDGKQTTNWGGSSDDGAAAVARQPNGKIVAVGHAGGGTGGSFFALARYNPDGSLDSAFSGNGRKTTNFPGLGEEATGVALQPDGKIVAVGVAREGGIGNFALARYNPNGTLDTSFSGDGKQRTDFPNGAVATGVAVQSDGKIAVVGGTNGDFALARYNPTGSLDTSFSGDGKQTTDFGGSDQARGVALQGARIVAVGLAGADDGGDFALARYNPNGSLDTSFSGDGKQATDFGAVDEANGVALQGDGKIVAVGRLFVTTAIFFALARYNPNGSLDSSFSGGGRQTTGGGLATGVALQGDGKIVVVGIGGDRFDFDVALARYNPTGSLDTTFSGDGRQTTDFGGDFDGANGVALQPNGKIIAVGVAGDVSGPGDFALARYLGG